MTENLLHGWKKRDGSQGQTGKEKMNGLEVASRSV